MKKLKGYIISNGYLKTVKYMEILEIYKEAAKQLGISLECIFNNEILMGLEEGCLFIKGEKVNTFPDFVLFLDKDIRLAYTLERLGLRVFNSSKVIEICDDKAKTFQALSGCGIPMPKTIIAPLVFKNTLDEDLSYILQIEKSLGYPLIIKECYGSFGEQVYLVRSRKELITKRKEVLTVPHVYQEFIKSSIGRDVRLNVVGGKVVASMLRTSKTDFRANISNGGQMQPYTPPKDFEKIALKVCKIINANFAGVDLLFGEKEEPILCEINSNAHIKNIQLCTGINVAHEILAYIVEEL